MEPVQTIQYPVQRPELKRNYPVIWLIGSSFFSFIGSQVYLIAIPLIVLQLTGSPLAMGMVAALEKMPNWLLPLAGSAH